MPADVRLTAHFHLSQFTVCPDAISAGQRNEPLAHQVENLRRVAQALEVVRASIDRAPIHVLRAFRRSSTQFGKPDAYSEGRGVDFIIPSLGTPRDVCAFVLTLGLGFERLVCAPGWVHLELPAFGREPRRQLQTGVFEHGRPMQYLEGLL